MSWRCEGQESPAPPCPKPPMFHDTTRLRFMSRPSLKDALHSFSGSGSSGGKLGRIGVSQSFKERIAPPMRPTDPPPPPPTLSGKADDGPPGSSYSLAKKFFSFNKTEMRRINRFLGIGESELRDPGESRGPSSGSKTESHIYDIAENDEQTSDTHCDTALTVVDNSRFYTTSALDSLAGARPGAQLKKNVSLRLRPKSIEFSAMAADPVKPPRAKRERSKSFTPRSNPLVKTSMFNRSLSHIPKSASNSSLNGKAGAINSDFSKKMTITGDNNDEANDAKRTFSSSDLVTIFPDEERRSFKDIRKILSSPSISSSSSSSTNQIYRPKSQLSNSSSVINNSIKEEQIIVLSVSAKAEAFVDHIYEEIQDKDVVDNPQCKRPLPPLPSEKQPSPSRSSPIISDPSSPVKSIFEGATKYDILNYLEDARERGLTDCDLDLEEEEEAETGECAGPGDQDSANMGSSDIQASEEITRTEKLSSVEIERNDSGLGSETGRCRSVSKLVIRKRSDVESAETDVSCLDCDQALELQENKSVD